MSLPDTARFSEGVQIINGINNSRLPKMISRIAQKLDREEPPFTKEEMEKLSEVLDLGVMRVQHALDTIKMMLQQAAYYNWKPAVFMQQLANAKLEEDKSEIMSQAWQKYGREIISVLKKSTLSVNQLEKVGWHLNLQVAQNSKSKTAETNVVFQLETKDSENDQSDTVLMEFNHNELLAFYNKLEVIQEQIDALS